MKIVTEQITIAEFRKKKKEGKLVHQDLASGHWSDFSLNEQLANVGTDVSRAIRWREKGNIDYSQAAFHRALELLFLTIEDPKNRNHRLKELCRLYEVLVDYFAGDNIYGSSDILWEKYFLAYNYAARIKR